MSYPKKKREKGKWLKNCSISTNATTTRRGSRKAEARDNASDSLSAEAIQYEYPQNNSSKTLRLKI
jgi:hypothetical protein